MAEPPWLSLSSGDMYVFKYLMYPPVGGLQALGQFQNLFLEQYKNWQIELYLNAFVCQN